MTDRRVVISGIGLVSPIGDSLDAVSTALSKGTHGIRTMPEWAQYGGLSTRLGAPCELDSSELPRKRTRTMGRVALLALAATTRAITDAGLSEAELRSGRVGLAYGSTHGSSAETEAFCARLDRTRSFGGIPASSYLKFMSHTCASNLATYFGIRGRIITTCAACVSASQAIGFAYETVRGGIQDVMVCGGAEELHVTHAGVFDIMYATSTRYNDRPSQSPRPFDAERDGLVVGEGAGTLVVEPFERAQERGARVYAEIVGYGTSCDGTTVTSPSADGTESAIRLALADADLAATDIDYINAHGTATEAGDIAEAEATARVFGAGVPVSSTKSFTGHTLGACGALESIFCIAMMRDGFIAPNRNLDQVDRRCLGPDFVVGDPRVARLARVMNNNFAFGGINTSLIIARS